MVQAAAPACLLHTDMGTATPSDEAGLNGAVLSLLRQSVFLVHVRPFFMDNCYLFSSHELRSSTHGVRQHFTDAAHGESQQPPAPPDALAVAEHSHLASTARPAPSSPRRAIPRLPGFLLYVIPSNTECCQLPGLFSSGTDCRLSNSPMCTFSTVI